MINDYAEIRDRIVGSHLKATHQRIVILDAIMKMGTHPSVDQVYESIKNSYPSISLATVYKATETFVSSGLLSKVATKEGHMRYDPNLNNHGHIHCNNTNEIIDYYDEELNSIILDFFKRKKVNNLKIKNITLQINGDKIDLEKDVIIK